MGWGIEFNIDIFLSKMQFSSLDDLQDTIDDTEDTINRIQSKILMYASASIDLIVPNDWEEEPIDFVNMKVTSLLDDLREELELVSKLNLYAEYLKEKQKKE